MNITPYIPRKTRIMPPEPVLNAGLRKYLMSSMGSSTRFSQTTKPASTTVATVKASSVEALPQPLAGASISP